MNGEKIIGAIKKSDTSEIQARVKEYKGNVYVDIREFITGSPGSYTGPTKKGLNFNAENFPNFLDLIKQIENALQE